MLLLGLGRYGTAIANFLKKEGLHLLAVDFNPEQVRTGKQQGIETVYGDVCDQNFIDSLPLEKFSWVISAIPQHDLGLTHEDPRLLLIDGLKYYGYGGKIAVSTYHTEEMESLIERGADIVFLPFMDAADRVVSRISEMIDPDRDHLKSPILPEDEDIISK